MNLATILPPALPLLLLTMPHDDHEPRDTTPTEAAPELRDTQPPGADDAAAETALRTLLPLKAPVTIEDTYLERAIRVVAETGASMARDREERRQQHDAVLAAISRSDANQSRNYEMLRDELGKLKASDIEQSAEIADLRLEVAALREQLSQTERQLAQAIARVDVLESRIPPHEPTRPQAAPSEGS